jgi:hypothetical protein
MLMGAAYGASESDIIISAILLVALVAMGDKKEPEYLGTVKPSRVYK